MKNTIIIAVIAAVAGLGVGYLIFGGNAQKTHDHNTMTTETNAASEEIWTCSMHPQIRQPDFGDCAICGMDLILLEEGGSDNPLILEMTESAVKLANIQTTVIGQKTDATGKTFRLTGKVQADERQSSSQVAHIPGRIEKLYVTFTGEQVNKGQKLATIYSPDLITAQRELLEAVKLQEVNPSLLEAARNKLRYLKIGEQTIKNIEENGSIQENFTIYAEESGVVTEKRVSVGDYIRQGEPLFALMNLSRVWVLFDAYEEDLAAISVGDKIEFTTPSAPDKIFKTTVTFIDPIINAASRTAAIRTEVNNSKGLLKPEMLVTGTLQKRAKGNSELTVPKSAVLWTGKRSVVYVKVPDTEIPSFEFKEVELGESMGTNYRVLSGLNAGEDVVTYGSFTIDAAAQLNNQASMMNRNVEIKKVVEGVEATPDFRTETPAEFQKQIAKLTEQYLILKDAFVETDATAASSAAAGFQAELKKVDMSLLKGEAHEYWMEKLSALKPHSKKIAESEDVEKQREQFEFVSIAMINSIEAFGTGSEVIYVQHCPMAFGNKGADWLAKEEGIRNHYFGDKMMRCGVVKRELE